ncbi:MAG: RNA polymerase sigma factor [Lachnospiraceae bacterium]|nr:RNA polymerase sigma factor [Lachnospiraceae bacterium]
MPETDGQLYLKYVKENDTEAFRQVYEKYRDSLILFLNGIVGNIDDAEELMMDTFAILSSRTVRYKEKEEAGFKTWLYAIAKNRAKMFLRKHKTMFQLPEDDEMNSEELSDNTDASPEESLIKEEQNKELYTALESLDSDTRQVIYLIYFEGLKPPEISRIMKKNIKQIYNMTARGKTALKDTLERRGYSWDM